MVPWTYRIAALQYKTMYNDGINCVKLSKNLGFSKTKGTFLWNFVSNFAYENF